ncbi:MAG: DUF1329 domain-containing protein [Endozoicomonas sp.]|uniref:DUF1329 domain-containing protein n=1 Tax=Endozoicomonas sp. TaxID=1892382 RepID=UPI003D9B15DF
MLLAASPTTQAKIDPEVAAKLGNALTPVGAEKKANVSGSIPAWDGQVVETMDKEGFLKNPFQQDKPLYVVNSKNINQYSDVLTEGHKALIKAFPDSYKIPVYKTRRTTVYSTELYEKAKLDAVAAELANNGNGVVNFKGNVPFPVPANGLEVYWNHINRFKGGSMQWGSILAPVQTSGSYSLIKVQDKLVWPDYLLDSGGFNADNLLYFYTRKVTAPARMTGNVQLVREPLDHIKEARGAWVYNAGQRRVRRAPTIAYDGPAFASEGMRTSDNIDMFNGSPDRYNMKLLGKKEMLIPYNAYQVASRDLKYSDIIKKGHINQEYVRYELHRVWVVEATLKEGERHIYAKRVFYVDEDTWQIAHVDHYDERGNLWRVGEGYMAFFSKPMMSWYSLGTLYDLIARRYFVDWLMNEESKPIDFSRAARSRDFTPSSLRRSGR